MIKQPNDIQAQILAPFGSQVNHGGGLQTI